MQASGRDARDLASRRGAGSSRPSPPPETPPRTRRARGSRARRRPRSASRSRGSTPVHGDERALLHVDAVPRRPRRTRRARARGDERSGDRPLPARVHASVTARDQRPGTGEQERLRAHQHREPDHEPGRQSPSPHRAGPRDHEQRGGPALRHDRRRVRHERGVQRDREARPAPPGRARFTIAYVATPAAAPSRH